MSVSLHGVCVRVRQDRFLKAMGCSLNSICEKGAVLPVSEGILIRNLIE